MLRIISLVVFAIMSFICIPTGLAQATRTQNSGIAIFPSSYASDSDFLNLVNDNRAIREQSRRQVFVYYNCLIKANPDNNKRQDPMVLSRSRWVAFSEIPEEIYEARLERSARLINEHNKAVMQGTVERDISELKRIKWNEIKKEVNSIVTGGRNAELEKYGCPISEADLRIPQSWPGRFFERPVFIPPYM